MSVNIYSEALPPCHPLRFLPGTSPLEKERCLIPGHLTSPRGGIPCSRSEAELISSCDSFIHQTRLSTHCISGPGQWVTKTKPPALVELAFGA